MQLTAKQREANRWLGRPEHTFCTIGGGARSGKTLLLMRAVLMRAIRQPRSNHAVIRRYVKDVRQKILKGTLVDVMNICFEGLPLEMDKMDMIQQLPNGSRIWYGGLDDAERADKILGAEYSTIFFDELSQISRDSVTIAATRLAEKNELRKRMYGALNPPQKSHWVYRDFIQDPQPGYAYMQMNPRDNLENIDPSIIQRLEALPEKQRQRFLLGEWQDEMQGALWQRVWFRYEDAPDHPDIITINLDPAVTCGEDSDDHGIIVLAKQDERYYIKEDATCHTTPAGMCAIARDLAVKYSADKIIYEGNQGGDAWEALLKQAGVTCDIVKVTVSASKLGRAEPIAALYENGRVFHPATSDVSALEDEQLSYTGLGRSPNRMDALVMGISYLETEGPVYITPSFGVF